MEFRLYAEFGESWIVDEKGRTYWSYDGLMEWNYVSVHEDFECNEILSPSSFLFVSGWVHFEKWYNWFLEILKSTYNKYEAEESTESMFPVEDERTSFINNCVPNNLPKDTLIQKEPMFVTQTDSIVPQPKDYVSPYAMGQKETKVAEKLNKWDSLDELKIDITIFSKLRLYKTTELIKEKWMNHWSIKKWLHTIPYCNKHILKEDILNLFIKEFNHE